MKCSQPTRFPPLTPGSDGTSVVQWFVDASFAVHRDMRSHTRGVMIMGKGAVIVMSNKQKINAKSSTEAEIVGADDALNIQVWTRLFMSEQHRHAGVEERRPDKSHQDDTCAFKLEVNGKPSSGKRTRHIDMRHFFMTDRVKSKSGV